MDRVDCTKLPPASLCASGIILMQHLVIFIILIHAVFSIYFVIIFHQNDVGFDMIVLYLFQDHHIIGLFDLILFPKFTAIIASLRKNNVCLFKYHLIAALRRSLCFVQQFDYR